MQALQRKLWRDLHGIWSQALTIALVVASGVAGFISTWSAYDALAWSRDRYYSEARFADVFASVKRAPQSLEDRLMALPGVAQVQTSLAHTVQIILPGVAEPMRGRLIGLDAKHPPKLNEVFLRSGRMVQARTSGPMEVLVSEAFASARQLAPGARLQALMNGKRQELEVVGIALSPEYIFAGMGGSPDVRGFGIFWMDHDALAAAYDMGSAFNQLAVRLAPGAHENAVIDALDRTLAPWGGRQAHGREEHLSHRMLDSEIREQQVLGTVLPSIFLLVAAFLLQMVLSRHIAIQREQVAALKALGYENRTIGLHYLQLVLVIVALGLLLGVILGSWLGEWFTGLYASVFRFPQLLHRIRPELLATALAVTVLTAVLATVQAIQSTVKLAPAEAMRPPAPGHYRAALAERWGLQAWLPFNTRMVLRHMERSPWRALLTICGLAASMAIVVSGSFWRDSIELMLKTQFEQVLRGDVTVALIEPGPASVAAELMRLPHVTGVEASRSVAVKLVNGHLNWRGSVQGRTAQGQLQRIVDTRQVAHPAPAHGLLLTDRLARKLKLRPGDEVRVELQEGSREVWRLPVAGTVSEMMGMNAYIELQTLNRWLREGHVANQFVLSVEPGHETELLQALETQPRVAGSFSKAVMLRNVQGITARNLLIFSAVLTAFASVIAIGVVYNQTRIALAERAWELASLRVLGFTQGEVSALLLGEWMLEMLIAMPLGWLAGYNLSEAIVRLIQTNEFYFAVRIAPRTYAFATLCVVLAGLFSAWIVQRRIRQLDLVSVLKVRE